jgi:hypothetical protein
MKLFGLFQPGTPEPLATYEGIMTVISGSEVTIYGERGEDNKRTVVAVVQLQPGQRINKVNPGRH